MAPLVPNDSVFLPPAPYPPKLPPQITLINKINQSITEEININQPYHNHKNGTRLATYRVNIFTCSGVNNPSNRSQAAQYLEARYKKMIERANAVTYPLTGDQMEYGDLIKDPKLWETWTTSIDN